MRILRKFWWVVAVPVAVWWYRKRMVTPAAYNGVPKYLDPASRGAAYAGGTLPVDDFTKSLFE